MNHCISFIYVIYLFLFSEMSIFVKVFSVQSHSLAQSSNYFLLVECVYFCVSIFFLRFGMPLNLYTYMLSINSFYICVIVVHDSFLRSCSFFIFVVLWNEVSFWLSYIINLNIMDVFWNNIIKLKFLINWKQEEQIKYYKANSVSSPFFFLVIIQKLIYFHILIRMVGKIQSKKVVLYIFPSNCATCYFNFQNFQFSC